MSTVKILPLDLVLIEKIGGNYTTYREWLYDELKLNAISSDINKVKVTTSKIDNVENSLVLLNEAIARFNNDIENINIAILRSKEVPV